jgi:phosphoserine phosphatase
MISSMRMATRLVTAGGDRTGPSTHAVVLLGRPQQAAESASDACLSLASVTTVLAQLDVDVHVVRWLADRPVTALELLVSAPGHTSEATTVLRTALAKVAVGCGVDVAVEPVHPRRGAKRLVVFDVDSTLLRGEVIDMLRQGRPGARGGRDYRGGDAR